MNKIFFAQASNGVKKIIPAILTNNVADLQSKLQQVQGLTDWVQIDIMDGKFVDNTSISIEDVFKVKPIKDFSVEAHLMVQNPASYFLLCQENNIKRVIFHIETFDMKNALSQAQKFSFQKGLALNPETPIKEIIPYIDKIDVAVLMSVNPGLQGQEFILETLQKISELKKIAPRLPIEVDGGINLNNIKMISEAGADYLVVGSGLFAASSKAVQPHPGREVKDIKKHFEELKLKIQ